MVVGLTRTQEHGGRGELQGVPGEVRPGQHGGLDLVVQGFLDPHVDGSRGW